jgi:hypothetical protein
MKNRRLIIEMIAPKDETKFHNKKASGKSEYRRGIPLKPRKCCGKKVKFTPINIMKKWAVNHEGFREKPNIIGNQKVNPAKIANTAPIDNT